MDKKLSWKRCPDCGKTLYIECRNNPHSHWSFGGASKPSGFNFSCSCSFESGWHNSRDEAEKIIDDLVEKKQHSDPYEFDHP